MTIPYLIALLCVLLLARCSPPLDREGAAAPTPFKYSSALRLSAPERYLANPGLPTYDHLASVLPADPDFHSEMPIIPPDPDFHSEMPIIPPDPDFHSEMPIIGLRPSRIITYRTTPDTFLYDSSLTISSPKRFKIIPH